MRPSGALIFISLAFMQVGCGSSDTLSWVDPEPTDTDTLEIYMCENLSPGDVIMNIIAEDSDDLPITYSIRPEFTDALALFEVVGSELKIKGDVQSSSYNIDGDDGLKEVAIGFTATTSTQTKDVTAKIILEDENDNTPTFTGHPYSVTVYTSLSGGDQVYDGISASDADDSALFGTIVYSNSDTDKFTINANTGVVTLASGYTLTTAASPYTVTITATDTDPDNPESAQTTLTVTAIDPPSFDDLNTAKSQSVNENVADDFVIYTVSVSGGNEASRTIIIKSQSSSGVFRVVDGKLMREPGVELDKETLPGPFTLTFTVSDDEKSVDSAILTVNLVELNDNKPVFTETNPTVTISETLATDDEVYTAAATDADVGNPGDDMFYSLIGDGADMFAIDENTGKITVAQQLDYDTKSQYSLTLTAADSETNPQTESTTLTINIRSAEGTLSWVDPDPTDLDSLEIYMCEDLSPGDVFFNLYAEDTDNLDITYSIRPEFTDALALFEVVGSDVKIKGDVQSSSYNFDGDAGLKEVAIGFTATTTSQTKDVTAKIIIEDANDNTPTFTGHPYSVTVYTSLTGGDQVYDGISASDADDSALFGTIVYSNSDTDKFTINANTGVVTLASGYTLTSASSPYTVTITATDTDPDNPESAQTTLTVTTKEPPSFDDLSSAQSKSVDENVAENDGIYPIRVSGENEDSLTVTIKTESPSGVFRVVDGELKRKPGVELDKETLPGPFTLTFTVSDGVMSVDSAILTINLDELNDNKPVFTKTNPTVTIAETLAKGDEVYTAAATDADVGNPGDTMIFSLTGDGSDKFAIDPDSGKITVDQQLDYGTKSQYILTLTAADSVSNPQTESTTLTINLKTGPTFSNHADGDTLTIKEKNTGDGAELTTLQATDEDGDTEFTFTIESQVPELFTISGAVITFTDAVDYDAKDAVTSFTLTLKVSDDTEYNTQDGTITLTVNIEDSNDELPIFAPDTYSAKVDELSTIGSSVKTVTATDADVTDTFNTLKYSLTSENGDPTDFDIDEVSGKITVGKALNWENRASYVIHVVAEDTSAEPKTSSATVNIDVVTGYTFPDSLSGTEFTITEEQTEDRDYVIKTLTATDKDDDGTVEYSITSQTPTKSPLLFEIKDTTKLVISRAVDADLQDQDLEYTLELLVSDGKSYSLDDTVTVTVRIEDSNENAVFAPDQFTEKVNELSQVGYSVLTVTADDVDITESFRTLKYSLASANGQDHVGFVIDADTGEITVGGALTYRPSPYEVLVVAEDVSDSPKSSTATVNMDIVTGFVFENPLDGASLVITEIETADREHVITSFASTDKDNDGTLEYSILSEVPVKDPPLFEIVNDKDLVITREVDADIVGADLVFTLRLKASDDKDYSIDDIIDVTVTIEDSNEKPVFEGKVDGEDLVERTDLLESTKPGSYVYKVSATDPDLAPEFNKIYYTLPGNPKAFSIESNGEIYLKDTLDYNVLAIHDVEARASNGGEKVLFDVMHVLFDIRTKPSFDNLKQDVTKYIDENVLEGVTVFEVLVSDKDQTARSSTTITDIKSQSPDDMFKLEGLILKTKTGDLDAETQQTYKIIFNATDGVYTSESAELTVIINDLNDNSPVVTPVQDITINELKPVGEIGTVTATDADATSPNNKLTYTITGGNDDQFFGIDPDTGTLRLVTTPVSKANVKVYDLTVKVSDGGSPPETADTSFRITINDAVNECGNSPCQNMATCTSYLNMYECTCVTGFNGTNCENNMENCTQTSCNNGGTCIDDVHSFTCDCPKGWTGPTCLEACSNNRYGRNCANVCSCNASRLASDVGNQQCEIKSGDCSCNNFWRGVKCETDVNECDENQNICNDAATNRVCQDFDGGYNCRCKARYSLENGICTQDPPVSVIVRDGQVAILFTIEIPGSCENLDDPDVYAGEERKIVLAIQFRLGPVFVFVRFIRCGSLVFETSLVTNDTAEAKADLANRIQAIRDDGSIMYGGENLPVQRIVVNGQELPPTSSQSSTSMATKVCDVYLSYTTCPSDEECVYEDGMASCKTKKADNLPLILGLGVGLTLALLMLVIIVAVIWHIKKRQDRNRRRHRKGSSRMSGSYPTRYYDNKGVYNGSGMSKLGGFNNLPEEAIINYGSQRRY